MRPLDIEAIHTLMRELVPIERRDRVSYVVAIVDVDDDAGPLVVSTFQDSRQCAEVLETLAESLRRQYRAVRKGPPS